MGPSSSLSFAEAIILSHFALFSSKQGKNPVLISGWSTGNVRCNADCMTRYNQVNILLLSGIYLFLKGIATDKG